MATQGSADRSPLVDGGTLTRKNRMKCERMKRRVTLAAAVAVAAVILGPLGARTEENVNTDTFKALDLFGEVFDRVRQDYVTPVTDQQLVESAIRGMLSALDPHSS